MCCFRWPCAGSVAVGMFDVVSLRRRSVLRGCTFALQIHCGSCLSGCLFEAFCWNAHACVCSSVVLVGPVVQSACFDVFQQSTFRADSLPCHWERFHGDVARHTSCHCKVNPLRALGGSSRSRCGAARVLRSQSEPSAHFGRAESLWLSLCAL